LVQEAKSLGMPALYFTNMVSARPLFGPAGAGALAAIVAAQTKGRERFGRMVSFFDGVGKGETAGYGWKDVPKDPPGSKERYRKAREAKAKATSAVGT
jgi:chlorophyllide a reductase subunit Y